MKIRFLNGWMALLVCGIIFTSCEKRSLYNPDQTKPKGEFFDFSTSREIKMNISYDVPEGYRVAFDIYDQQPMMEKDGRLALNAELQPIAGGVTNGYGKYDLEKVIPAAVKEFYVYTSDLFATTLMRGKIEETGVTMEEVDLSELLPRTQTAALETRASSKESWKTLGDWNKSWNWSGDTKGRPNYIDSKKKVDISSRTLSVIRNNFPDKKKANSIYFKKTDLYVAEDAEVWLTVIGSAGEYNNTLGYYCYTGKPEDLRKEDIVKIVAFPRAKIGPLKSEECVKLKYYNPDTEKLEDKFPQGTSIGWVLLSDGFDTKSSEIQYNKPCFYSYAPWNPEKKNKDHMILFKTKNNGEDFVAFGFEDMNNDKGSDLDCNDVMFHVVANPIDAITDEIPEVPEEPEKDIVKEEIYRGTLAFEDLWPRQGDYDLNDVVVKYKSTATIVVKANEDYDSYGRVTKLKDEFSLVWAGANLHNAFGYQMNLLHSDVKSLKVTRGTEEEVATAWDKALDKVTVMLTEDVLNEIGKSTGKAVDYTTEVELTDGILVKDFNKEQSHAPYNPFIVSQGGLSANRVEVHLPMYAPTAKNNMELLGTADDRSEANVNRYYVSEQMFPFALHIYGDNNFINKEESVRIDLTYPKYKNWVEKNGKEDADWYKFPAE